MGRGDNGRGQKGFILIIVAAFLTTVVWAVAGLAVDVSRAYSVKRELAKAVDAAALAGAANLYPLPVSQLSPPPAWATGASAASTFVANNTVAGEQLTTADVQVSSGYWSSGTQTLNQSSPAGVCNVTGGTCTVDADCAGGNGCFYTNPPAVQVTASKTVPTSFARMLGWNQFQASATAVAVFAKSGPETAALTGVPPGTGMPPGTMFPIAIEYQLVDLLTQSPSTFTIGPSQSSPNTARWCNWGSGGSVNANTLTDYIQNLVDSSSGQAPQPLRASDSLKMLPTNAAEDMTAVFAATTELINAGKGLIFLPVVDLGSGNDAVVRGFARAQLLSVNGDTINGRFIFQKLVR